LPFGVSVTVVLFVIVAMRHVPLSVPPLLVTWTQLPAKYGWMAEERPVTSVLPVVPLCAVPLPSEESTVAWPVMPALSTVRSP
jgi:hypothetical protein